MNQTNYKNWIANSLLPALAEVTEPGQWLTTREIRELCREYSRTSKNHLMINAMEQYRGMCGKCRGSYSFRYGWNFYSFTDRIKRAMDTATKIGLVSNVAECNTRGHRFNNFYKIN